MKKRSCPSCGTKFIRGKVVLRITTDGAVRQRVCQSCAKLASLVLASDAPSRCENCGTNLATVCKGCIIDVMRQQEVL